MYVYLLLVTIAFVSFPTLGMESLTITTVTEEEGTLQEEAKIEENEKRQGGPAAGVGESDFDDEKAKPRTQEEADCTFGRRQIVIDEETLRNFMEKYVQNHNGNPRKLGEFIAERDAAHYEAKINDGTAKREGEYAGKTLVVRDAIRFTEPQDSITPDIATLEGEATARATHARHQKMVQLDAPSLEGQVLAKALAARDFFQEKERLQLIFQHPLTHLKSLSIQAIESGIVRGISVCGELAGATFWKSAIEPGLSIGVRTIYENTTESGRKNKIDRQYIENQNEIKTAAVFIAEATEQIKFEQQQEYAIKNNLQKYSAKLKNTTDSNKKEKYKKKIEGYALTIIDSKDMRKQAAQSKELLIAEIRNKNKRADELIQKRYRHSFSAPSEDKEKRAQKIAAQYLNQKSLSPTEDESIDIELSPLIEDELVS